VYVTAWAIPPGTPPLIVAIPIFMSVFAALIFSRRYKAKYWDSRND
jgi:hypothetical protein